MPEGVAFSVCDIVKVIIVETRDLSSFEYHRGGGGVRHCLILMNKLQIFYQSIFIIILWNPADGSFEIYT